MPEIALERIGDGEIGGKAAGFERMQRIVREAQATPGAPASSAIGFPHSACVTTALFFRFVQHNRLESLIDEAIAGRDGAVDKLSRAAREGSFPEEDERLLAALLDRFDGPIVVRSSSLLEDQKGASFAGKYESIFVGNVGTTDARRAAFLDAVRGVYASTWNADALAYRRRHGFLDDPEGMACLVQEVVGRPYGSFFLPAMAGVAFSQNGYCWSREVRKADGLVRLVMGLGTTAVGRGYVRLFSPPKPEMRPEGTEINNVQKCSQKKVDVVDLETGEMRSVHFRELIRDGFTCYPGSQSFVSLRDGTYLYRPVSNLWDAAHIPILTMDGALAAPWMGLDLPKTIAWTLAALERGTGGAVDVEFAVVVPPNAETAQLVLLQTRPLSQSEEHRPVPIPALADADILFTAHRNLPTSQVPDIEYIVSVDEQAYHGWPHDDRQSVARVVGKVGEALAGKRFALIGPGRWGSWNPQLGVPVRYNEINHCCLLVEVARRSATYVPEVSFGSHFFQDLIEDGIAYLPLYPHEPGERFNEELLAGPSVFATLLPDDYSRRYAQLVRVIHVPSVAGGRMAHAILNGETEAAVVFLK